MNVVMTAYSIDPRGGSEKKNAWDWVMSALVAGHHVTLVTTPEGAKAVQNFREETKLDFLNVIPLEKPSVTNLFGSQLQMYMQYVKWQKSVGILFSREESLNFNAGVHTSWGNVLLESGLTEYSFPVVIYPSGGGNFTLKGAASFYGKGRYEATMDSFLRRLLRLRPAARKSLRRSALVLAENGQTAALAKGMGAKRVIIDFAATVKQAEIVSDRSNPNSLKFLWVGRLRPRKGALLALMAFHEVVKKVPHAQLTVVGDGAMKLQLENYVRKMNLVKNVTFTGAVTFSEVQNLYLTHSYFIFSSLRDATGSQVLEAAAKGLPIITLQGLGIEEWISESFTLFANRLGSAKSTSWSSALKDAIVKATEITPSEWKTMSDEARVFASRHTYEHKMLKISAMIDSVSGI